ncbi:MAG: hypothetical protein U9O82_09775 [Thermodesulfobacteriota bacterium]|nr:hypothetical protein [Thermodesulfobacteriota bacterium]
MHERSFAPGLKPLSVDFIALILDGNGRVSRLGNHEKDSLPEKKFFPFDFTKNIGGIEISSHTRDALDKAEPHIGICLNGINELLKKEMEFQETADEMLFLSDQLNFLFKMADRTIGINKSDEFFEVILAPVRKAVDAEIWKLPPICTTWAKSGYPVKFLEKREN